MLPFRFIASHVLWEKARAVIVVVFLLVAFDTAAAQKNGGITGIIKPAAPNVVVIAANQVTGRVARAPVKSDGTYSLSLRPGAYRLSVAPPYFAKFDKTKNYGEHALIRDD